MSFKLQPETHAAIAAAENGLASYATIDDAVTRAEAEAAAAQVAADADAAALAALDAEGLFATTDATARAAERDIAKAAARAAESRAVADRKQRIVNAVKVKRAEAEALVHAEQVVLANEVSQAAEDALIGLGVEIVDACQPLIRVLRKVAVMQMAMPHPGLGSFLADINIPHPAFFRQEIIRGHKLSVDGKSVDLLDGWKDDLELLDLHAEASRPRAALNALKRFTTKAQRQAESDRLKPRARGYTTDGVTQRTTPPAAAAKVGPAVTPRMGRPVDASMGAYVLGDPDLAQFR